jgi:hypothetical protein
VSRAPDPAEVTALDSWKPPADGFERKLWPGPRERRWSPLTRRQVLTIPASWPLAGAFSVMVFSLNLPPASLWRHEALVLLLVSIVNLVWFTRYQIGQLLGLRPPHVRA